MMPEWVWDMAIKAMEQESKSEWEHDHEILKAYSDGASDVLDKVRAEIADYQKEAIYSDDVVMTKRMVLAIIDEYKAECEENNKNESKN